MSVMNEDTSFCGSTSGGVQMPALACFVL
ncbi:hypothetical protein Nmel_015880 [Mimus melanotis]